MPIPQDIIDSIKDRVDFVEIASEYVELRRSGRHFVGRCPFHAEKTPSFFVRDEEASFHCFGCGKKGSVFNFVMELKGMTFPEAVRFLADRVGITVPESSLPDPDMARRAERVKLLRELLRLSSEIYAEELCNFPPAERYLRERGLGPEIVKSYRLGYAPRAWSFLEPKLRSRLAERSDVSEDTLREGLTTLGLIKQRRSEEGKGSAEKSDARSHGDRTHFDMLRERIIFPIINNEGSVIAFGGRTLNTDPNSPKYLNTGESPLYLKRQTFYGIDRALASLRHGREAIVVEGYMDVLSMVQGGFGNTIATCGTAITAQHAQYLRRFVDRVTIAFDGDLAGRKAAAQCFEVFLNTGIDVSIALFPDGLDPDSAIRSGGPGAVSAVLEHTIPAVQLFLEVHLEQERGGAENTPAVVGRVADRFARATATVENPVEREFLLKRGAMVLGTSVEALDSLIRREGQSRGSSRRAGVGTGDSRRPPPRPDVPSSDSESNRRSPSERTQAGGADQPDRSRGVASPSRSAPRGEKRGRSSEAILEALLRQVVVAALAEPALARAFLEIEGLVPRAPAPGSFGARTRMFLEELVEANIPGLGGLIIPPPKRDPREEGRGEAREGNTAIDAENSIELRSSLASFRALLQSHQLDHSGMLAEAVRQLQVGGWEPATVLESSGWAARHWGLRGEVEQLRTEEQQEGNEGERLRLAQEKLLRRRRIEQLRSVEEKPLK